MVGSDKIGGQTCAEHGILFGQIIATSHDLTLRGSWGMEILLFQVNLGWFPQSWGWSPNPRRGCPYKPWFVKRWVETDWEHVPNAVKRYGCQKHSCQDIAGEVAETHEIFLANLAHRTKPFTFQLIVKKVSQPGSGHIYIYICICWPRIIVCKGDAGLHEHSSQTASFWPKRWESQSWYITDTRWRWWSVL